MSPVPQHRNTDPCHTSDLSLPSLDHHKVVQPSLRDAKAISNLNTTLDIGIEFDDWDPTDIDWIRDEIRAGNFYVIKNKRTIVGAMCYWQCEETNPKREVGFIPSIAVSSKAQGNGIGRALIKHAIEVTRKSQLTELHVQSLCAYDVADFYKKLGFTQDPEIGEFHGLPMWSFEMFV